MAFIPPLKTTKSLSSLPFFRRTPQKLHTSETLFPRPLSNQVQVLKICVYALVVFLVLFAAIISFFARPTPKPDLVPADIPVLPIEHPNIFSNLVGRPLFVFGDSIVDVGNLNFTTYPYGMDLESWEAGRFTNGLTIADYLALRMHSPIPRAYSRLKVGELEDFGANFACGGCGILARTRGLPCKSLEEQISQLRNEHPSPTVLGRALYLVSTGTTDFIFTFAKEKQSFDEFAKEVISVLEHDLVGLYNMGARYFLINDIGPLGCIPDQRHNLSEGCNEKWNEMVRSYNWRLKVAVSNLAMKFENTTVILADSYKMFTLILEEPRNFDFTNISDPCCGDWIESKNMYYCNKKETDGSTFCDREAFLFFDGAHPTQHANQVYVNNCLSGKVCHAIGK